MFHVLNRFVESSVAPHTVHPSKITLREELASILKGFEEQVQYSLFFFYLHQF